MSLGDTECQCYWWENYEKFCVNVVFWASVEIWFLVAFAKLRRDTISFVVCVYLSVRMEQLGFHWAIFIKLCIFLYFGNVSREFNFIKSDKNNCYFTGRAMYIIIIIIILYLSWSWVTC